MLSFMYELQMKYFRVCLFTFPFFEITSFTADPRIRTAYRFFMDKNIKKIENIYIPNEITEVKYRSDLTLISSINIELLDKASLLFKSMKFLFYSI